MKDIDNPVEILKKHLMSEYGFSEGQSKTLLSSVRGKTEDELLNSVELWVEFIDRAMFDYNIINLVCGGMLYVWYDENRKQFLEMTKEGLKRGRELKNIIN